MGTGPPASLLCQSCSPCTAALLPSAPGPPGKEDLAPGAAGGQPGPGPIAVGLVNEPVEAAVP